MSTKKDPLSKSIDATRKSHAQGIAEIAKQRTIIEDKITALLTGKERELRYRALQGLTMTYAILTDKQDMMLASLRRLEDESSDELHATFEVVALKDDPE